MVSLSVEFQPRPGCKKMTINIERVHERFQKELRILRIISKSLFKQDLLIWKKSHFLQKDELLDPKKLLLRKSRRCDCIMRVRQLRATSMQNGLIAAMAEDSRFLFEFEFEKLQAGAALAWGDGRFLLNPFQMKCNCTQMEILMKY